MNESAPRPRGRPGTAADTRARLLSAAVEVFLERGYADTRVQDITNAAGFTSGALYAHFNSRMEVLAEALVAEGDRLVEQLATLLADFDVSAGQAPTQLAALLTDPTRNVDRLLMEALTLTTRVQGDTASIVTAIDRVGRQLAELAIAAQGDKLIDTAADPEAVSLVVLSIILGATVIRALDLPRADPDAVAQFLTPRRHNSA